MAYTVLRQHMRVKTSNKNMHHITAFHKSLPTTAYTVSTGSCLIQQYNNNNKKNSNSSSNNSINTQLQGTLRPQSRLRPQSQLNCRHRVSNLQTEPASDITSQWQDRIHHTSGPRLLIKTV